MGEVFPIDIDLLMGAIMLNMTDVNITRAYSKFSAISIFKGTTQH